MNNIEKLDYKKNNAKCFIEATRILMDSEGFENISIRKIAKQSGFHNSTIYLYFKDIDELILLASMKDFREYSAALASHSLKTSTPFDNFITIWSFFCDSIFNRPHTFYNFFFCKYSNDLQHIISKYYELFPDEKEDYSKEIEEMYYAKNIRERNLKLLKPLTSRTGNINGDNIMIINEIIISCCKSLLEQKCNDATLDSQDLKKQMLAMLTYIINNGS